MLLLTLRKNSLQGKNYNMSKETKLTENDIYGYVQLSFEMSNVEDEGQICALYWLLRKNYEALHTWDLSKNCEEKYE